MHERSRSCFHLTRSDVFDFVYTMHKTWRKLDPHGGSPWHAKLWCRSSPGSFFVVSYLNTSNVDLLLIINSVVLQGPGWALGATSLTCSPIVRLSLSLLPLGEVLGSFGVQEGWSWCLHCTYSVVCLTQFQASDKLHYPNRGLCRVLIFRWRIVARFRW